MDTAKTFSLKQVNQSLLNSRNIDKIMSRHSNLTSQNINSSVPCGTSQAFDEFHFSLLKKYTTDSQPVLLSFPDDLLCMFEDELPFKREEINRTMTLPSKHPRRELGRR